MSKPTILIVDNNLQNRDFLESILSPYYDLVSATSSNEALQILVARKLKIRLILFHLTKQIDTWLPLFKDIKAATPFPEILFAIKPMVLPSQFLPN